MFNLEKTLTSAAAHCDELQVREDPKKANHGPWIKEYLAFCGLPEGNPWCAAFVAYHLAEGGYDGPWPKSMASVRSWMALAVQERLFAQTPRRGDLFCWVNPDGKGHIGFVTRVVGPVIWTIEGNTNTLGSREGDRVARKKRIVTRKYWFIRLT